MKALTKQGILRVIDANLNRSREGLRVCEDVARFVVNSPALTKELKAVRHGIRDVIARAPFTQTSLFKCRDSEGDIGRDSRLSSEMNRRNAPDIFIANIQRVKESLRVLEEFFKLIDVRSSGKISRLRFRTYDIEKKAFKRCW